MRLVSRRANITLFEALLGFEMNITHLDNRSVFIKHDAVSTPGFFKTVANEGMPVFGGGGTYGDLVVMFDIDFPKKLDDEEKELLGRYYPSPLIWPLSEDMGTMQLQCAPSCMLCFAASRAQTGSGPGCPHSRPPVLVMTLIAVSSVLDEDELKNIEDMIFRRNMQEVLAKLNKCVYSSVPANLQNDTLYLSMG